MNKFSNRLTDCRSRLLDAEAILNHLHHPENLHHLLENCSPEVTIGAMIDKAWDLVANASGDCEAMTEASDEDLKAELKATVRDEGEPVRRETARPHLINSVDDLGTLHTQTHSMLMMMLVYLEQAREGGSELNGLIVENYVGQLIANIEQAEKATQALVDVFRSEARS